MSVIESTATLPYVPPPVAPPVVDAPAVAVRPRRAGYYGMLDAWRGVACLWVVCHHAIRFLVDKDPSIAGSPGYAVALNGALGVWMFFVISGYCIANTAAHSLTNRKGGWVMSRVRRIFPPMWASALLAAASSLFAAHLVHRGVLGHSDLASLDLPHQSVAFFVTNLTLTQELFHQVFHRHGPGSTYLSGVYWTLCYEVGFYAIVAAFLTWSRRHGDARRMLNGLHAVTAVTLAGLLLAPARIPYPFDLWPYFGLGVLLFDVVANGWRRATIVAATVIVAGVIGYYAQHPTRPTALGQIDYLDRFTAAMGGGGVSLVVATAFAIVLLGLHPFDERLSRHPGAKALGWVGLFSYSLYLTHMTLIGYAYKACEMGRVLPRHLPVYLAVTVLGCVGFAWSFFWLCERPFLRNPAKATARVTDAGVAAGSGRSQARQSV
jgi:peptidoglycan/LPS O-acetylase OafA/YrhL